MFISTSHTLAFCLSSHVLLKIFHESILDSVIVCERVKVDLRIGLAFSTLSSRGRCIACSVDRMILQCSLASWLVFSQFCWWYLAILLVFATSTSLPSPLLGLYRNIHNQPCIAIVVHLYFVFLDVITCQ